jgi:UDP-glucose 4-epimerase
VAANRRAADELGWRPRLGDLQVIVDTAWRWHAAWPGGYTRSARGRGE